MGSHQRLEAAQQGYAELLAMSDEIILERARVRLPVLVCSYFPCRCLDADVVGDPDDSSRTEAGPSTSL